jgi:hypothetical protein
MPAFKATILKYSSNAEKTGWTYVDIPPDIISKLKLKDKKGFRIKGVIDDVKFEKLSTYPVGEGNFIMAINGDMKKKLGKKEGAMVSIKFERDESPALQSRELLSALKEEKEANVTFKGLVPSHQNYFHRYVATAKTSPTKAERIVNVINAMYRKQNFGEMIRGLKKK